MHSEYAEFKIRIRTLFQRMMGKGIMFKGRLYTPGTDVYYRFIK